MDLNVTNISKTFQSPGKDLTEEGGGHILHFLLLGGKNVKISIALLNLLSIIKINFILNSEKKNMKHTLNT